MERILKRSRDTARPTNGAVARTVWSLSSVEQQQQILRDVFSGKDTRGLEEDVFLKSLCWGASGKISTLLPSQCVESRIQSLKREGKPFDYEIEIVQNLRVQFQRMLTWMLRSPNETLPWTPEEVKSFKKTIKTLQEAGLVNGAEATTGKGIQFCLASEKNQVSELIASCVEIAQRENQGQEEEIRNFALSLPQHAQGVLYNCPPGPEASVINKLFSVYLLFKARVPGKVKGQDDIVYTIHPMLFDALDLEKGGGAGTQALEGTSHRLTIIVETNFRVYGYCTEDSALFFAKILSQFLEVKSNILNNKRVVMLVCLLTYNSAIRAFKNGVSARHIEEFFKTHLRTQSQQALPETVLEQIYLWEEETRRLMPYRNESGVIPAGHEVVLMEFTSMEEEASALQKMKSDPQQFKILGQMPGTGKVVIARRKD